MSLHTVEKGAQPAKVCNLYIILSNSLLPRHIYNHSCSLLNIFLSDPPIYLPFLFPLPLAESEPHLSCCRSFLTSFLSPLFPSCSSERGREQSQEDRGHVMDTKGKKMEQTSRKVTLIEVRGNQERVTSRSPREGLGKTRRESCHGVHRKV